MSWYDDFIDWASGSGSDDTLSSIGSDVTVDDIVGGTSNVLDTNDYQSNNGSPMYGSDSPTINPYDGYTTGTGYTNGQDSGIDDSAPKSLSAKSDDANDKGIFGKTTDFVEKNKKLTDMGLGLIGGAYNSSQKKKEDNKAYERMLEKRAYDEKIQKEKEDRADARRGGGGGGSSAMEMLAAKDALEQAKNARFSASITGLQPTGLINKGKKLTYVGGKPVYTNNGSIT